MPLSVIFGTAFEVPYTDPDDDRVRDYRHDGRHWIGSESAEIMHVCDDNCLAQALPDEYLLCLGSDDRYVSIHPFQVTRMGKFRYEVRTADVHDFDPGDNPYVLCENCKNELLRDDDKFIEMFGHRIGKVGRLTVLVDFNIGACDPGDDDILIEGMAWDVTRKLGDVFGEDNRIHDIRVETDWPETDDIFTIENPIGVP